MQWNSAEANITTLFICQVTNHTYRYKTEYRFSLRYKINGSHCFRFIHPHNTALNTGRVTNLSRIVRQGYKHSTYILCFCIQNDKMFCPFLSFFLFCASAITEHIELLCYYIVIVVIIPLQQKILHNHHHHHTTVNRVPKTNIVQWIPCVTFFCAHTMHVISFHISTKTKL